MAIIAFSGLPGAGKSTQAEILAAMGFKRFAHSPRFRELAKADPRLRHVMKSDLVMDKPISAAYTALFYKWLEKFLAEHPDDNVILDGTPRTVNHARGIDVAAEFRGHGLPKMVLFKVDPAVAFHRATEIRRRSDDDPEHVKERIKAIGRLEELLDYYASSDRLIEVDADRPTEEVTQQVLDALQR